MRSVVRIRPTGIGFPLPPGRAAAAVAMLLLLVAGMIGAQAYADDKADLISAVKAYFDAEMAGDLQGVWNLIAPSSVFKRSYTYPMYQEMIRGNAIQVKRFVIEEVMELVDRPDPENLPNVEKLAVVRVLVLLAGEGAPDMERRSVLTFLKEGGKWYKG
ncbi:MAG: hypothetical protein FJ118_01610 [Deltaproteobacteria bacterium]|nr:hypothetical protein [Deltaproteobacteria bacterium]